MSSSITSASSSTEKKRTRMANATIYTEDDVVKALKLYLEGKTHKQIWKELGEKSLAGSFSRLICLWRRRAGIPSLIKYKDWESILKRTSFKGDS